MLRICGAATFIPTQRATVAVLGIPELYSSPAPQSFRRFSVHSKQRAKKKSASNSRYLSRQNSDPYVRSRKSAAHATSLALPTSSKEGLPDGKFVSRSAFKLFELEQKHHFLTRGKGQGKGKIILDLGAAPGGWTQMALRMLPSKQQSVEGTVGVNEEEAGRSAGRAPIFALDLLPLHPEVAALPGVNFIQGDFESEEVKVKLAEQVRQYRADGKVDVILSDILANTTGSSFRDGALSFSILQHLLQFAHRHLSASPTSFLVLKIFPSPEAETFRKKMLQYSASASKKEAARSGTECGADKGGAFDSVKTEKPPASRKESREVYWICKGFRGSEKTWTLDEWYEMEEASD